MNTQVQSIKISVVSIFPEMFVAICEHGITSRALKQGIWDCNFFNPRDYSSNRRVDDRPYGGGPGMVMQAEPIQKAIAAAKASQPSYSPVVIYLSPQGKPLTQAWLQAGALLAQTGTHYILLCGRYEGVDERVLARFVDYELSIGDYVLSGGELAAMIVIDAMVRLLPGALGHEGSALQDSFVSNQLDHEHYTRPEVFDGIPVPAVLLSGDHEAIAKWRAQNRAQRTARLRPDLSPDERF